jgi:hypothetical protein
LNCSIVTPPYDSLYDGKGAGESAAHHIFRDAKEGLMKWTIIVTDTFVRFRLPGIVQIHERVAIGGFGE